MNVQKSVTEKKTTRTGKAIGKRSSAVVSLHINDDDRAVSRMWEIVKKYHSQKKMTAAETARKVVIRGLISELEEIALKTSAIHAENVEQKTLFE